jgi:hypothetical protein
MSLTMLLRHLGCTLRSLVLRRIVMFVACPAPAMANRAKADGNRRRRFVSENFLQKQRDAACSPILLSTANRNKCKILGMKYVTRNRWGAALANFIGSTAVGKLFVQTSHRNLQIPRLDTHHFR